MITRSRSGVMSSKPQVTGSNIATAEVPDYISEKSTRTAATRSSHSSATVRARKAAAEASVMRRQLERERQLADIEKQVEERELQAELAAIDAEVVSGHSSKRSIPVSIERTQMWVKDHENINSTVDNRGPLADGYDTITVEPPGRSIPQNSACMATRDTAPPIIRHCITDKQFTNNASEVEDRNAPLHVTKPVLHSSALLQAIADTAAAAKSLACGEGKPKKPDLPIFSGDALQWLHFKRIYNFTKSSFSTLDNIARLQSALRGDAREAVAAQLMSSEDHEEIMRALEDNFARPELIVYREVAALRALPRLGNDLKELGTLANRIRNCISTIRLLNQVEYLYSPELFHSVLGKLNSTMKLRWTDFAMQDTSKRSKLEILSDYLRCELDQHIKFGLSPDPALLSSFQHTAWQQKSYKRENVNSAAHIKTNTVSKNISSIQECCFCKKDHNIKACPEFKLLSIDDRWRWLREAKVCYRCLKRSSHQWKTCKVNPCGINGCVLRHHVLLHGRQNFIQNNNTCTSNIESSSYVPTPITSNSESVQEKVVISATAMQHTQSRSYIRLQTLLKIIPVTVSGPAGDFDTFALLDDGSTATLIDACIASQIGVTGPEENITVNCISGLSTNTKISYVNFYIRGRYTNESYLVKNARSIKSLSLQSQMIPADSIVNYSHLSDLVDVLSYIDATPMVLIGADHWHLSINREVRKGSRNQPVACLTALGWVLYGLSSSKTKIVNFVNNTRFSNESTDTLEYLIKENYKLEAIGISKKETLFNKQEKRAIEILESTTRRLPSGRFEIGLPWREDITRIPNSYSQALSRFLSLERSMSQKSDFALAYHTFMKNMVDRGYVEECHSSTYHNHYSYENNSNSVRWYLPHFGVYHPQKRKLRVVHDAAARNEGVSLNSMLLPGPDLLQSLLGILFRFREGHIALTADIKEMFPQIRVRENDRDALRFLWRPYTCSKTEKQIIKEYRMTSVIFGACSSPFIAQFIKNKNAKEFAHLYPKAVDAILFSHYMDDYLDSHNEIIDAAQIAADIVKIHSAACLEMRGWISNVPAALNLVPLELRAVQPLEIDLGSNPNSIKALGIAWDPTTDNFSFRTGLDESIPTPLTKRKVLSHLMRMYDPLGLLAPIVIGGRILFQQAWRSNIDWDTEFSPSESAKWIEWFRAAAKVVSIKIPRWYASSLNSEPLHYELHLFADASELAYACVAYWRITYRDQMVKLVLISSKARVTPLKPTSIPRLELQAALIASRLALAVKDSHRIKPTRTFFWTDSMTVLGWLRSDARTFKPFVAHRVGEIIENTSVTDWRWVPSALNVADDATRARNYDISVSSRWFLGPSFLFESPEKWPLEPAGVTPVREELKVSELVGVLSIKSTLPTPVTASFNRFDNWLRLVRASARILQAVLFFRTKFSGHDRRHVTTSTTLTPLTADFMEAAEKQILLRTQLDSFKEVFECLVNSIPIPKNNRLVKLSPTLGDDNILRLAGRIKRATGVDQRTLLPIILDGKHLIVRLLVQHHHRIAGHGNNEMVVNELRQKYWIIHLRPLVRSVAGRCLFCRIRKSQPAIPLTGDLPLQRLAHHRRPFTFTGVDYFGPINVTIGRRHEKRYVALYTCMTIRAVHLELVHSLSADSAILSLRRFIARRGIPKIILSDNGTAFVGANRLLKEFYRSDIKDFAANNGISWSFIPAAAPNFGGCWERLVRAVKVALSATLRERAPKEEVLTTLLLEAEAIVNSRPLTHVSVDPDDDETLTPFHFLIGTSSTQTLPTSLSDRDLCSRLEYRKALRLADLFWNRWVREILPTLQPRHPGCRLTELDVGDPVLIVDENMPRGMWPRGRISTLHPGRDGVVRVVDVDTTAGTLRRPRRKIVCLPK